MSMPPRALRRPRLLAVLTAVSLWAGLLPVVPAPAAAASTELFFSEYVEGSSNNKALEIFNGTGAAVDLAAGSYSVQMFFNGSTSAGLTINLAGTVADGDVYVVAHGSAAAPILAQADQTNGAGWFNGDDAVALLRGTELVDVIGQVGVDPGSEWGAGLTSTGDNTLRRGPAVTAGDTNGADAFDPAAEWDGFAQDSFGGLGSHLSVVAECGGPLTTLEGFAATRTVTGWDADGTVTNIEISSVSPDPGTIEIGPTTPAAGPGGTATADVTVTGSTPAGIYTVTVSASNNDAPPQSGACSFSVSVQEVKAIGEVQGSVADGADALTHRSGFAPSSGNAAGQTVTIHGVIYQRTLARTSAGASQNGFFIQNTAETSDADPNSSDGIFVFMGAFTSLIGGYVPTVGDEVVISGRVTEFFNLTQLSSARMIHLVRSGVDLDAELAPIEADPPAVLADANRYWERREGMRLQVPAGSIVTADRDVFGSTFDGELWVVRGDSDLAERPDPYARRVFRDAHPLDDVGDQLFDNGNGQRIMLASLGLKAASGDSTTLIAPLRVFDVLTNSPVGGLYFSFGKYGIQVGEQPSAVAGADPSENAPPQPATAGVEYSTATYNVENLYDFRDDPFDGCDFGGNPGCPGVTPPFDYVPAGDADYRAHLAELAAQIVGDLHSPEILLIQEAEDQDICFVAGAALDCDDGVDNRDGKPDTLQELALAIAQAGGPSYDAAYDRNGADDRGIVSAFMYRTDSVELLAADPAHPVLGSAPQVEYATAGFAYNADVSNPKSLNAPLPGGVEVGDACDEPIPCVYTRDPLVGYFRVWRDAIGASVFTDLYAISNHFSSTPDARVAQRTEQARYNAAIVQALRLADDGDRIVTGGDFNVFPRPDDPVANAPTDQLAALYDAGLSNLWNVLVEEVPQAAYSYVFQGQAQTLDSQFVTGRLFEELVQVRVAHINADWPADFAGDGPRGASDHDPQAARYDGFVTIERLRDLVAYYRDVGAIDGGKETQLFGRLDRAEAFAGEGKTDAAVDQLVAFGDQAQELSPRFIDAATAEVLRAEATLLANAWESG